MQQRRGVNDVRQLCSGPGQADARRSQSRRRMTSAIFAAIRAHCFVQVRREPRADVVADERIGITRSADLPWRFTLRGSLSLAGR